MNDSHSDRLTGSLKEDQRRLETDLKQWMFLFWFGSVVIYTCFYLLLRLSSK